MSSKPCSNQDCAEANPQPLESFGIDKRASDGRQSRCLACYRAYTKAKNKADPTRNRARANAWNKAHPERRRARINVWYKAHPEASHARTERRRLHMAAAKAERFSQAEIFERDGWVCQICGDRIDKDLAGPDPQSPSIDHVIPVSRGGKHTRANVQATHLFCNQSKGYRVIAS